MPAKTLEAVSRRYHELDPSNFDEILTPGFVGHHPNGSTWDLENHRKTWSTHTDTTDEITYQLSGSNMVATMFIRRGVWYGAPRELQMMQFKRFEGDKIAEVWEQYDQVETNRWIEEGKELETT